MMPAIIWKKRWIRATVIRQFFPIGCIAFLRALFFETQMNLKLNNSAGSSGRRRKSIREDRCFMLIVGYGSNGIVNSGFVTRDPYLNYDWAGRE